MPLNPVSISCVEADPTPKTAAQNLDATVATAVAAAKAVPTVLLNQITIVPLGTIWDGTNYVASATVLYSTS